MAEGDQPDDSQKTEEPSAKKLEEARKKGQVALSREVNNWIMLLMATLLIGGYAPIMFSELLELLRAYLERAADFPSMPGGFEIAVGEGMIRVLYILALPVVALMLAGIIGPFAQTGPIFAPESITPKLDKISIVKGFERLFSLRAVMEFVKGLAKIGLIGVVSAVILYPYFDKLEHMVGMPMTLLLDEIQSIILRLMTGVLVVLLLIALADLIYQRQEHYKKMRMTKQELKDEFKQTEGDPQIRGKLRQLRLQRARQRMMQNVPKSDVVITNPTHFAIALEYKPEVMDAPKCVAKGVDAVALRIREVAKEHKIEIVENPPLARTLYDTVELDETIPPEQYKAVAEVISFVFRKRGKGI
ncbi:MAG: flagellar biosynthesis protein FlhB [Alphaproteobacteria bacterium]|nr:flagellar biosynthesis protein FlhB [Alphaproteobacteria bacterium]